MRLFEIEQLTYYYPETSRPALDRIDLLLDEGEFTLVAGPSGGGKTTLARALSGLVPHFFGGRIGGRVSYRGGPLDGLDRRALHAQIGVVTQDAEKQILMQRVEHELRFGPENLGLSPERIGRSVAETAGILGISDILRRRTDELSGGMKQRTVLGAVMAMGARIMILDEPTSQLDPAAVEDLRAFLHRARNELGYTILLVEHKIEPFLPMADRLLFVEGGRLTFDGAPDEFRRWAPAHAPHVLSHSTVPDDYAPRSESPDGDSGEPVARLDGVSFSYGDNGAALKGIDLAVDRSGIVSILGPNGAGKSTLLKIICGILPPSEGTVTVAGRTPSLCPNRVKAGLCGYLSQNPDDFLFNETVLDEVAYTLRNLGRYDESLVLAALDRWGIAHLAAKNPRELSAGERQCVALAAATIAEPPLLLLDEPTRGQDGRLNAQTGRRLSALAGGAAVVVVTQDVDFAYAWSQRIVLLSNGRIVSDERHSPTLGRMPCDTYGLEGLVHGEATPEAVGRPRRTCGTSAGGGSPP